MSWIKTISYENASKALKRIYDRIKGPNGQIDNVLTIHSLRPHTLVGHMTLYKNVLHNSNNTLPKWYLETLGSYVSHLNKCDYCFLHHFAGLKKLLQDDQKADAISEAIKDNDFRTVFNDHLLLGVNYAKKLTFQPNDLTKTDIDQLIEGGFTEGEVLEINQVVSYFNYVNRTVLGLGVSPDGEVLGLSPKDSDDASNWNHT